MILQSLREDAVRYLGQDVSRCVVSVPAYFNDVQRTDTKSAAEMAGFKVERIINEPTAAAIAHGMNDIGLENQFMVFDLGGGTFDVCLMEYYYGSLEVKSVAGISNLGGEDFTRVLTQEALDQIGLSLNQVETGTPGDLSALFRIIELAKRSFSNNDEVRIEIPPLGQLLLVPREIVIKRNALKDIFRDLTGQFLAPVRKAIRGADLNLKDINKVILVGGGTKMPLIKDIVQDLLGIEVIEDTDPDFSVVKGAAVQADLFSSEKSISDIVVTDILSHSLGVDHVLENGEKYKAGYFRPIIHRNTVIPVSKVDIFEPVNDKQKNLKFTILEGESRYADQNHKLGEVFVKNLPVYLENRSVSIRFTYDPSGILNVETIIIATGIKSEKTFTRKHKLSPMELEQASLRIVELKKDPMEREDIKVVFLKGELLYGEVPSDSREILESYLYGLEKSIAERDTEQIEAFFQSLKKFCETYEQKEDW
ncbi:MAG: Hsp70 family protein [bacterium]|nr:Hsp70 family protein [bacterium]